MSRRKASPFSLSFLDIMFCGFGAVVLLVLVLNHETVKSREQIFTDLRAEAVRLEKEVLIGEKNLVEARNSLKATDSEIVLMQGQSERVIDTIQEMEIEIARMSNETLASREHVNQLSTDLKSLDKVQKRLGAAVEADRDAGEKVREFKGEGDRQYLTGLKMGGKRILVLVDASASMLDETIINVIRRRNLDAASRISAPKWQRALKTTDWLISNLPNNTKFQLYSFNTVAKATLSGTDGNWLETSKRTDIDGAISALYQIAPEGGTSLYHAFSAANALSPPPDNILLITDGLPTQGRAKPVSTTVSAKKRLDHFEQAAKVLKGEIPVNTILLPMEGDAWAAAAFWALAINSEGSFMTPSRDWP
ncbi:MAG: vWA domain-containing protein [Xanthomonadales bacterium]|nr:vWA domain-containing protein [Xanthomonadales bacterium]